MVQDIMLYMRLKNKEMVDKLLILFTIIDVIIVIIVIIFIYFVTIVSIIAVIVLFFPNSYHFGGGGMTFGPSR